jgi:hypothetical protein
LTVQYSGMSDGLTRRQFLKATAAGTLLLAGGWSLESCGASPTSIAFFTPHQRDLIDAAAARLLPIGAEIGAAGYIERLLTAFEYDPPRIYAGGPFSGRHPYPDNSTGEPSQDFPIDSFERYLPLTRVQEIAWRVRLYGSQNTPGGDYNDAVLGATKGWRDQYQDGLRTLDGTSRQLFGLSFVSVGPSDQDHALTDTDQSFVGLLFQHTIEAAYAAPEYGGNRELAGWKSSRFDGDSQPLGYSIYDKSTETFHQLTARPLSTPNPDEDFVGFSSSTIDLLSRLAPGLGGQRFF